jgi:hypothetical protein
MRGPDSASVCSFVLDNSLIYNFCEKDTGEINQKTYFVFFCLLVLLILFFVLAFCLLILFLILPLVFTLSLLSLCFLLLFILFLDFLNLSVEVCLLLLGFDCCSFIGIRQTKPPVDEMTGTYVEEVL